MLLPGDKFPDVARRQNLLMCSTCSIPFLLKTAQVNSFAGKNYHRIQNSTSKIDFPFSAGLLSHEEVLRPVLNNIRTIPTYREFAGMDEKIIQYYPAIELFGKNGNFFSYTLSQLPFDYIFHEKFNPESGDGSIRKKDGAISILLRFLADSNRRIRFCRPPPSHSAKEPFLFGVRIYKK